jgi:hypothetical protein
MADAIVIDRGYLGAEVDVEVVAIAQKRMISLVGPLPPRVTNWLIFCTIDKKNKKANEMQTSKRPTLQGNPFWWPTKCWSK